MARPTALDVANYFLAVAPENTMTNLKLEKMCAYAQAVSLAYLGRPLFDEAIEAWEHGPVVPIVYHTFKENGRNPIESPYSESYAQRPFGEQERLVLAAVNAVYGKYEAWALRNMSHQDFPGEFGTSKPILHEEIQQAFEKNFLVSRLKASDMAEDSTNEQLLSEKEFWDAVAR